MTKRSVIKQSFTKMGTIERREREKKERRELVQKCALKVFARHGFDGATMDEIAKEAELSKGAIYLYFRDKEELFRSLVRKNVDEFHESLAKAIEEADEPELRIHKAITALLKYFVTRKDMIRLFLATSSDLMKKVQDDVHKFMLSERKRAVELFKEVLKPAFDAGLFHDHITLEIAAVFFQSTIMGAMSWFLMNDIEFDNKQIEQAIFNLFTRGVFKDAK